MQHKIARLEEELQAEDIKCTAEQGDNGTIDGDPSPRRQEIMEEVLWRLEHYQRFVLDHSQIKARPNAAKRQVSYLHNWLFNNNGPIRPAEASFAEQDDLMPVVSREKPPLRRLIDRYDILSRFSWWRIRKENLNPRHYNHKDNYASHTTIYSDEARMDKFVTCVTIVLGLMMLIAPLWLLQYVHAIKPDPVARLKIITWFLIGFPMIFGMVALPRPLEVLTATAAYGAFLMVFMQLQSSIASGYGQ
ncbi:MAG: hypothetical protein Q9193_003671 [Seirophora villosa]